MRCWEILMASTRSSRACRDGEDEERADRPILERLGCFARGGDMLRSMGGGLMCLAGLHGFSCSLAAPPPRATSALAGNRPRPPRSRDAVLINQVVIGGVGAGKPDHAPRHHIAVAAIDGVAEEPLERGLPQVLEELLGRHTAKILATGL